MQSEPAIAISFAGAPPIMLRCGHDQVYWATPATPEARTPNVSVVIVPGPVVSRCVATTEQNATARARAAFNRVSGEEAHFIGGGAWSEAKAELLHARIVRRLRCEVAAGLLVRAPLGWDYLEPKGAE